MQKWKNSSQPRYPEKSKLEKWTTNIYATLPEENSWLERQKDSYDPLGPYMIWIQLLGELIYNVEPVIYDDHE